MSAKVPTSGVYKLISNVDSNCLDCEGGGGKKKTKVLHWHYDGKDNQQFQLHPEGKNAFRIASLVKDIKTGNMLVVEEADDHKVQLAEFTGNENQQWLAIPTYSQEGAYVIKNVKSGLAFRNQGHGDPVALFEPQIDDKSQWYDLVPVE